MSAVLATDDGIDATVDSDIARYLNLACPKSFFLFAGAGSGKTRSLVSALKSLVATSGQALRICGQQVAVVTYTNAACDEIQSRLQYDPLVKVSTIHSFVWELIRGFNNDIRAWLSENLKAEIGELEEAERKGRGGRASQERKRSIESKRKRLEVLPVVKRFTYSPTGDNRERDALNHAEVIAIGAFLLKTRPLMQRLLIDRSPFMLIDESQDTSKLLMEAVLGVQAAHPGRFGLGLFGDTMQRIYADGKVDLGVNLPTDWARPAKVMNHRCPKRIVRLINKVRSPVDGQEQRARSDADEGYVRLFVCSASQADRAHSEHAARERMKIITGDAAWSEAGQSKTLILEHHMAAKRMGFFDMFGPLYGDDDYKTGLLDGTLPALRLFGQQVLPLIQAIRAGNKFSAMAVLRKHSPLLDEAVLQACENQVGQLGTLRASVENLVSLLRTTPTASFGDVLKLVAAERLFAIPESLYPFAVDEDAEAAKSEDTRPAEEAHEDRTESKRVALTGFLASPFSQIEPYVEYVSRAAPFDTHQNVKGREFPRVMVVMDDDQARGFMFSYEKLFGAKEKSKADLEHERANEETGIDRTRRLFYVTCSRSESSLALVAYSTNPQAVRTRAIAEGWFDENEVENL